jgi:hypothetical protein
MRKKTLAHAVDGPVAIPHAWHRLNEGHRTTALQDFLETPQGHYLAKTQTYIDFMHAHPPRISESHYMLQ